MNISSNFFAILGYILLGAMGLGTEASGKASDSQQGTYALARTSSHIVQADNDQKFQLSVALPAGYQSDVKRRYPVLYVLDGRILFAPTVTTYRMQMLGRRPEPIIIVGIDYAEELDVFGWFARRTEDFTPTNIPAEDALFSKAYGQKTVTGQASRFRNALLERLLPFVEEHYRVTSSRGLMGFSLGGLFAAQDLFQKENSFDKYMLLSAALWWDNSAFVFGLEEARCRQGQDLKSEILITYGGEEVPDIISPAKQLAQRLSAREYQGLKLSLVQFPGEDHMSVVPASISRAIKTMYVTKHPPGTE